MDAKVIPFELISNTYPSTEEGTPSSVIINCTPLPGFSVCGKASNMGGSTGILLLWVDIK